MTMASPSNTYVHCHWSEMQGGEVPPLTVISLIFFVFSLIHFSRLIFSVALMSSLSFLISCVKSTGGQ